jgi:hypothetical protein
VLLALLVGCIILPVPQHREPGDSSGSGKLPDVRYVTACSGPLRVGESRRVDVHRTLGVPTAHSDNGHVYVYAQAFYGGYVMTLPPLFPSAGPVTEQSYYLRLEFDDNELLTSSRLATNQEHESGMVSGPEPVPEPLLETTTVYARRLEVPAARHFPREGPLPPDAPTTFPLR